MISSLPLAILIPALLVGMVVAHELGMRLQRRLASAQEPDDSTDEGFILSGILSLLALLMAFSLTMAVDRFDERRDLMLTEAGALKSLAAMAETVSDPHRRSIQALLANYARARLIAVQQIDGDDRTQADEAAALRRRPLALAVRAAVRAEGGESNSIALIQAFDMVEDSAVRREALALAHLPEQVLGLLVAYAIISAAMLGYAVSASGGRHRVASSTLYVLLALGFAVMIDLDQPTSGSIRISQEPFRAAVEAVAASVRS